MLQLDDARTVSPCPLQRRADSGIVGVTQEQCFDWVDLEKLFETGRQCQEIYSPSSTFQTDVANICLEGS